MQFLPHRRHTAALLQTVSLREAVALYYELYEIDKFAGRSKCRVFRRDSVLGTTPVKIAFLFRLPVFL